MRGCLSLPLFHPVGWMRATFTRSASEAKVEITRMKVLDAPTLRFEKLAWSPEPGVWLDQAVTLDLSRPVTITQPCKNH